MSYISIVASMLIVLVSCGSERDTNPLAEGPDAGTVSIALKLTGSHAARLATVEVVVTGIDFAPIRERLEMSGELATGVVSVPVGARRLFTLNGYDDSGRLIFTGQGWSDISAGVSNTVSVSMRPVDTTAPRDWLVGNVPNLAYISFYSSTTNWDGDAEDDGIRVGVSYYNSDDNFLSWGDATVGVTYIVFIAKNYGSLERKYDSPWIEYSGYLSANSESFRIAFEDFGTYNVSDTYNTLGGDTAVPVIEELTITMSNGTIFSARNTGGIVVAD